MIYTTREPVQTAPVDEYTEHGRLRVNSVNSKIAHNGRCENPRAAPNVVIIRVDRDPGRPHVRTPGTNATHARLYPPTAYCIV